MYQERQLHIQHNYLFRFREIVGDSSSGIQILNKMKGKQLEQLASVRLAVTLYNAAARINW